MTTLAEMLEQNTVQGELYERLEDGRLRCAACAHRCFIRDGESGICRMRFNKGGTLHVPFGYVSGAQCDPIEKKPFFHVRPGSMAYSFGMLGCNFHCGFCQNWVTSQTLRDPHAVARVLLTSAEEIVNLACSHRAEIVVSTYNEPLITAEWSVAVFKQAKAAGLMTGFVSNGYATPKALEYLQPHLDLFKVDLKCYSDRQYRSLGGSLEPVLETIGSLHQMGIWVEVVTLLVPGFNDSREELAKLTGFLAGVSPDIPWHVSAFHKDYRMTDPENTTPGDLLKAVETGRENGLLYVYAGNLPGRSGNYESTFCPGCRELLVERYGYRILKNNLTSGGCCPACNQKIPGRWAKSIR
jgi:pyruvate formate lyase activating enzyme